jgi:hypothetical protein
VNSRISNPPDDPIVGRLRKPNSRAVEDVISLVGYVGPGEQEGRVRIFANRDLVNWIEVPEIIDSQPVTPGDELSPSVVFVAREMMLKPIFETEAGEDDGRLDAVTAAFGDVPFSTWNLIPETRYIAARLLGMIPYEYE